MSVSIGGPQATDPRMTGRRVRHEARDALAVVVFSAAASLALTIAVTVLVTLLG